MKKIRNVIIAFGILFLSSCETALDKFPLASLSPETFFSNEKELELFSNQFYTIFPSASSIYSESVDNITTSELSLNVKGKREIPTSGGGWTFSSLRLINTLLEGSKNCEDINVRNKYDAIARFFRAYFYFEKVKDFGDVPWADRPLGSAEKELYKPRDSREYIMAKIIEDLDFAINNLPDKKSLYRVTKWTALALKSRACLFEGTFRKYHNISLPGRTAEEYLQLSVDAANVFIEKSGYKLYTVGKTPYRDLFTLMDANSDEVILARDYNASLGFTHSANNYTISSSLGRPGLTRWMVNQYLMQDGSRYTDIAGYDTKQFKDECVGRDPRLAQTIRTKGYTRVDATKLIAPDLTSTMTGYQLIKYVKETVYDDYNKSEQDISLFRTAEVYLNYAEAKAELGTLTQDDLNKTIKLIRQRAGMLNLDMLKANANPDPYLMDAKTGYPAVTGPNKGVILEIRRERTIELIAEGFRYDDVMRWKAGKRFEQPFYGIYIPGPGTYDLDGNGVLDVCIYDGTKPPAFVALFLKIDQDIFLSEGKKGYISPHKTIVCEWKEDKDYLNPIPIEERLITKGIITQNPGWEDGLSF